MAYGLHITRPPVVPALRAGKAPFPLLRVARPMQQPLRPVSRRVVSLTASTEGPSPADDRQSSQASTSGRNSRNVAIFVEPSPFSHVSGMKNRFESLIRNLREQGDDVMVFTPDPNPPKQYHGAKIVNVLGFRLPFYSTPTLLLSLGLSIRVLWYLIMRRPDVIHVSSPGIIVFAAILYAKLLDLPLVVSYHTHVPEYIPKYTWAGLVRPMWAVIRFCHWMADLTLVTSEAMRRELARNRCHEETLEVWQRGVDTDVFNPRFRSREMRARMAGGVQHADAPILTYVGRLGAEKNLTALKGMLEALPGARLCFVGDGPERGMLEQHFTGLPVTFMGMLRGEDLSAAYASSDVFMMPSESETLGFVVLEAMASGVPVVAVAAGGLTDIISRPGETGLLYPPGDYAAALAATRRLIEDPALRARVGGAGRAEVERWGWGAATRRLREQQYERAIRKRIARRWFGFVAIRATLATGLRNVLAALLAACAWVINCFDYARPYRNKLDDQWQPRQVAGASPSSGYVAAS